MRGRWAARAWCWRESSASQGRGRPGFEGANRPIPGSRKRNTHSLELRFGSHNAIVAKFLCADNTSQTFGVPESRLGSWRNLAGQHSIANFGAVTSIALLNSTVLTTTRMPFALAEDGYLQPFLTREHSTYGTPSILLSAAIYCSLAWVSFTQLISVYAWLRIATSILTMLSLWRLRITGPNMKPAFRVPWDRTDLACAVEAPLVMSAVAHARQRQVRTAVGPVVLVLGNGAHRVLRPAPTRRQDAAPSN